MVHDRYGRRLRIAPYIKMQGIGAAGDARMHGCPRRCTGSCSSLSIIKRLALNLFRHLATLNETPLASRCELLVFMQPRLHRALYRISLARDKSCSSDLSNSLSDVK